jgi:hypothetical protein
MGMVGEKSRLHSEPPPTGLGGSMSAIAWLRQPTSNQNGTIKMGLLTAGTIESSLWLCNSTPWHNFIHLKLTMNCWH